jgi:glycosidase
MIEFLVAAALSEKHRLVTFEYAPPTPLSSCYIVGTFNNWDRSQYPLTKSADGRTWRVTVPIKPGVYEYLYIEDGKRWVPDPKVEQVEDMNNNRNSIVVVQPPEFDALPGKLGDGKITTAAVLHRTTRADVIRYNETDFGFRIRTRHQDVEQVWVEVNGERRAARITQSTPLFDTWIVRTTGSKSKFKYRFVLIDGDKELAYPKDGFTVNPASYPLPKIPAWIKDQVFYQIFPDRFANGNPANDGPNVSPWGAKPTATNRMGGDLAGVRSKLGYLQDLGITAIYFNPIFTAGSNHGYDTYDYRQIDPRFGTNEEFKSLVQEMNAKGMKVMLDGVFNHSGVGFFAFKDLVAKGAKSAYRDWYTTYKFPLKVEEGQKTYLGWFGAWTLPRLATEKKPVRDFILDVASMWIKDYGIAGWRLDAADQVGHPFWKLLRKGVKATDPNAWIVTEVWGDAHEYIQGDEQDNSMNYRWRLVALRFFGSKTLSAPGAVSELERIDLDVPDAARHTQLNLLSSHDTERLATMMQGDLNKMKQAVLFQFMSPGVPSVYYGDEVGLEGGKDPDCRRCFPWDPKDQNADLRAWTKTLIAFRRKHEELREDPAVYETKGDRVLALRRGKFLAIFNTGIDELKFSKPYEIIEFGHLASKSSIKPGGCAVYEVEEDDDDLRILP